MYIILAIFLLICSIEMKSVCSSIKCFPTSSAGAKQRGGNWTSLLDGSHKTFHQPAVLGHLWLTISQLICHSAICWKTCAVYLSDPRSYWRVTFISINNNNIFSVLKSSFVCGERDKSRCSWFSAIITRGIPIGLKFQISIRENAKTRYKPAK